MDSQIDNHTGFIILYIVSKCLPCLEKYIYKYWDYLDPKLVQMENFGSNRKIILLKSAIHLLFLVVKIFVT